MSEDWKKHLTGDRLSVIGAYDLQRQAEKAREHPSLFAEFVMRTERDYATVRLSKHQKIMIDFLWDHQRSVVILPIGHAKTFTLESLILYRLGKLRRTRGAVIGATQGQAKKLLSVCREYITNPAYRLVWEGIMPSTTRAWTDSDFTIARPEGIKDPSLAAYGIDSGSILGSRLDFIAVDDILNRQNTATKEQRDKTYEFFDSMVASRLEPDGQIIVSNSAWHQDDLLHRLERLGWPVLRMQINGDVYIRDGSTGGLRRNVATKAQRAKGIEVMGEHEPWDHELLVPTEKDPADQSFGERCRIVGHKDDDVLWPERFPDGPGLLARLRERHPITSEFNRLFMSMCRDDGEAMCKSEWIEKCKKAAHEHKVFELTHTRKGGDTYTGVDLAFSKSDSADYSAIFTFDVLPSGHRQILDIQRGRWSGPELKDKILATHHRYDSILRVENNAAQKMLVDILAQENIGLPIKGHVTGQNKANISTGVHSVFNDMAHGLWLIPNDAQGRVHPNVQVWIDECLYYTPDKHSGDVLMACLGPGALVTTGRGLVPIEQVVTGDMVLTHKSRWRSVTGTTVHAHDGQAVRLKAAGLLPMVATLNHPVWSATTRYNRRAGNRLMPAGWDFRLSEELRVGRKTAGMYAFTPAPSEWATPAHTRIDLAAYTVASRPKGAEWRIGVDTLYWRNEKTYRRFLEVDEAAAMLIGLYLAEGSIGGKRHIASFALHRREVHLAEFIRREMLRLFNATGRARAGSGANGRNVGCPSVLAARFFAQLGKSDTKGMPWGWMSWPLPIRLAVVRGWLMGDGCLTGKRLRLSGVSISRTLLEQMRLTLVEAGYSPTIGVFMRAHKRPFAGRPSTCRDSWRLVLTESDTSRFLNAGSALEYQHWKWTFTKARERTNSCMLPMEGGAAVRLADVTRFHYAGLVYNLHVDEDESYVAEGIAVHNSWFAREQAREFGALRPKTAADTAVEHGMGLDLLSR